VVVQLAPLLAPLLEFPVRGRSSVVVASGLHRRPLRRIVCAAPEFDLRNWKLDRCNNDDRGYKVT